MHIKHFCLCILFIPSLVHAQLPGNVSTNLRWWLKANAEVYTNNGTNSANNGQPVQQWNDQSAIGNNARQTTKGNKPTFATNQVNGNPTISFPAMILSPPWQPRVSRAIKALTSSSY